jgi:hypothetical protein
MEGNADLAHCNLYRLRFGLFSSPPAGVWGDGDYNFSKGKRIEIVNQFFRKASRS